MKLEFWIKRPNEKEGRKRWSILRRVDGAKAYKLTDPRIDTINALYKAGTADYETCNRQVEDILAGLRGQKPERERYLDANLDVFEAYWTQHYASRLKTKEASKRSARNRFKRALAALGSLDIASAPLHTIQERLSALPPSKLRQVAWCINALLKYVNRPERIELPEDEGYEISYLTLPQIQSMLAHLEPAMQALAGAAFATGCRYAELFGRNLFNKARMLYKVNEQRDYELVYRGPKRRSKRDVPVIPEMAHYLERWLAWDESEKEALCQDRNAAKYVREACAAAKVPSICFHDLRHSYAIYIGLQGASITRIAKCLGNDWKVCQDYYSGKVFSDEEADAVVELLKRKAG